MKYEFELLEQISDKHPQRQYNEDKIVLLNGLAVLMDGSTGLQGPQEKVKMNATEFVNLVDTELGRAWSPEMEFEQALTVALDAISDPHGQQDDPSLRYLEPAAGLVSFHICEADGIFHRIGDCRCLLFRNGKIIEVFEESPLNTLDQEVISDIAGKVHNGVSADQAQKEALSQLRRNRNKMNTPNGYGALTADSDCMAYLEAAKVELQVDDLVLLASDGFMAMTDLYGLTTDEEIFLAAKERSFSILTDTMRHLEIRDRELREYPRIKQFDDASAVVLHVSESAA